MYIAILTAILLVSDATVVMVTHKYGDLATCEKNAKLVQLHNPALIVSCELRHLSKPEVIL